MRPASWHALLPSRSVALGLTEQTAPSLVFVLAGVLLGPELFDVMSHEVLAQLDPVVSLALAVLGVFIGSGLVAARGPMTVHWLTGATLQGFLTFCAVAASMYTLLRQWALPSPVDPATAAVVLGLCSAVSAAVRVPQEGDLRTAAYVADFDDLLLVVLGGVLVASLGGQAAFATSLALAVAAGLIVSTAGAVLWIHADGAAERGVYVAGSTLLLAGSAAYAGASPLLGGSVAGVIWALTARPGASLIGPDLRKLQHPLVALLLLIAGASVQLTFQLVWVAAPLVLFRLTGKLVGSLVAARALALPPALLATLLAPPGILGIALALNIQQVLGSGDTLLVSAVTCATVGAELVAVALVGPTGPSTEPLAGQA